MRTRNATQQYNLTLLNQIKEAKEISYEELRNLNSSKIKRIFDDELENLINLGYVKCEENMYIFVYRP